MKLPSCSSVVLAALVIGGIALATASCDGERQRLAEERREELQAERRKGLHCLNRRTDNHDGFHRLVSDQLSNPGSMRIEGTVIAPVVEGVHIIGMVFSAKDLFGAMGVLKAIGWVDQETCEAVLISIE